jgi:phosphoribosyl-AMP cyclohydrolase
MITLHYTDGLIPVVVQDAGSREVLMVAYANDEAVRLTRKTGFAHFYSRSRNKLWKKGEESGHVQKVREILVDCDEDCLLYLVDQEGAACHTGYRTCFYRTLEGEIIRERVFDPSRVYGAKGS